MTHVTNKQIWVDSLHSDPPNTKPSLSTHGHFLLQIRSVNALTHYENSPSCSSGLIESRRLLLPSLSSFSTNGNKMNAKMKDGRRSAETSLRVAPPSKSNPTQNKCESFF
ncbi:unnamed protein product [Citrullus colocynthis]|uniref:Uncharacterized protein n=1 Tax=Citrullus colocynthis TaxID=252529 RepID=A0ABP0Y3K8_9ROSI